MKLRDLEFLIDFGSVVKFFIVDDDDDLYHTYYCRWPKSGGYLNYKVLSMWIYKDKLFGHILALKIKKKQ